MGESKAVLADGTVATWTGLGVCYCTHCRLLFGSITAFDRHVKRKGGKVRHDHSGLVLNSRGHYVTMLRDDDTVPV